MRHGNFSDEPNTPINWQVLKVIWPYLFEYKTRVLIALATMVLAKLAAIAGPFLLKAIVDTLTQTAEQPVLLVAVPVALILAYGLARFGSVILGEIRDTIFGRVTERAMRRIGLQVFKHIHSLDLDFHLSRRTGGLARDIERGITGISFLMRFFVFNIAPTLIEISLVIGIFLVNYGTSFAMITLIAVVCYVVFSFRATEWRTQFVREANTADSASNTRAIDSLLNYETVKYFTNESLEARRYDQELARWEIARRKNRLSMLTLNGGQGFIISLAMTIMMYLAAKNVSAGTMTIGDFVLINAFMMQLFMPLNFLGFVYREIKGSMANIERMLDLLATAPKVVDKPGAKALEIAQGRIDFNDVCFAYDKQRPILNHVSFSIEPGQKVAVVGASGAGKSTLVKLLLRFFDTTEGQILIDGQAVDHVTQHSLRQNIGIVPQDTVLFNDTLFENIRYGKPNASDDEVSQSIRLANLQSFISELPKGQDTLVGERGLKLSGGEKQRVAIARTILKHPRILVFDEATSSLDSQSEQAILRSLRDISSGHTSLVIAHRLSTIVDADNIVVLEQGRIVEQGTHDQLLAKQGRYWHLWQIQQRQKQHDTPPPPEQTS